MDRTSFCLAKEFGVQPVSGHAEELSQGFTRLGCGLDSSSGMEEDQRPKETVSKLVGDSCLILTHLCISHLRSQCQCTWFLYKPYLVRSERERGVRFQTRPQTER